MTMTDHEIQGSPEVDMWTPDTRLARHFLVRELDPEGAAAGKPQIQKRLRGVAAVLEVIRERLDVPLVVTPSGGYQPPEAEQSRRWPSRKPTSQHRRGRAADIVCRRDPVDVANMVLTLVKGGVLDTVGGVGCYAGFVHVDTRARKNGGGLALWAGDGITLDRAGMRFSRA